MAREYTVPLNNATLTTGTDFAAVFVNPGTTMSLEFLRAGLNQSGTATSAMYLAGIKTQVTAFPTLTSTTPSKLKFGDPVSAITGGTAGAAGTAGTAATVAGAGAKSVIYSENFNNLNGFLWIPTPRDTIIMNASAASGLGLYTTSPGSVTNWSGYLTYAELG